MNLFIENFFAENDVLPVEWVTKFGVIDNSAVIELIFESDDEIQDQIAFNLMNLELGEVNEYLKSVLPQLSWLEGIPQTVM